MMPPRKFGANFYRMIAAMGQGPMDARDVSVELGCSMRTARALIKDALEERMIYVHSFYKNATGTWAKVYARGDKAHALPPPRRTNEEKNLVRKGRRGLVKDWYETRKEKHARDRPPRAPKDGC